jgi:PRC-barrel domain
MHKVGEWRASKLAGVDVYNDANEKIGDINDVILDRSGKVTNVILGVGGFLGLGEHNVAVAFDTGSFGTNSSLHFQKLFQPHELMAMPPGRLLCIARDVPPFFTQVPPYWNSKFGQGLAPNPYHTRH